MKVLEGKYFGNITVKGIKEISLDYEFSFFPVAWGWYFLFSIVLTYILIKFIKRKNYEKENRYILDYIDYINASDADLYQIAKILHITHKKKNIAKDGSESFYQTEFGKKISSYLYQNTNMPSCELSEFKRAVITWLEQRYI